MIVLTLDSPTAAFYQASNFNGNLSTWDVKRVTLFRNTFDGASAFNFKSSLSCVATSGGRRLPGIRHVFQNVLCRSEVWLLR